MIIEVEVPDDRVEELQRMLDEGEYVGQRWDDLAEYIGDKALHKVVRL